MRFQVIVIIIISCCFSKNLSFSAGIDENINLLSLRNDFTLDESNNLFATVGVGLGFNMFFSGFKYDSNYRNVGNSIIICIGVSEGRDRNNEAIINKTMQVSFFRKLMIGRSNKSFLNLGITYWHVFDSKKQPISYLPVLSYNINF